MECECEQMSVNERIYKLRQLMKDYGIKAYIATDSDPHMSEYTAARWKARSWISGFTGSSGIFVATQDESCLWTDGRYHIQAEKQLAGSEVKLFKMGMPGVPAFTEWLSDNLKKGDRVGVSAETTSVSGLRDMEKKFASKGITVCKDCDLVGEIWDDRPQMPLESIFSHDIKYTGKSADEKIQNVRDEMKAAGADYYLVSSLDDIAWLFNIRGGDVPYVPVAISYALISLTEAFLFINRAKVPDEAGRILNDNGIKILDYEKVADVLQTLEEGRSIALDVKRTNCLLYDSIPRRCEIIEIDEITEKQKAIKNDAELENIKKYLVHDGIAMVKFLCWLEKNIGEQEITELTVAEKLRCLRADRPDNLGISFATIAGYRDHGAMMHYSASEESCYVLENKGLMVLDSGGQYLGGTTDITRTVVFDEVSEEEKYDFTMVLKALISLSTARFLYGAIGSNLDVLARKPLWDAGLDYKCGTGHGVGYCLSVHEGPQNFSQVPNKTKLEKGMIITIEPGIYREGKHGVRTENMVLVTEDEKTESGQFMKFETLTLCPISLKGIKEDMLTAGEKKWLNDYHQEVFEALSPYLDSDETEWLKINTRRI
jgi:Xaa-Pro aminopeptidase